MILTREKLLQRDELQIEKVHLTKEDFVFVRQMTGRERDQFEQSLMQEKKDAQGRVQYITALRDFRAKLAVNTLCDEKGNNLLQPEDYPTLSKNMSAAKLEKIVNVAQRLNAITEEDKEALVKNLEREPGDGSTSGSQKS